MDTFFAFFCCMRHRAASIGMNRALPPRLRPEVIGPCVHLACKCKLVKCIIVNLSLMGTG